MNLIDAFWNWVFTHAQTIQNDDVHLQVARMNFDILLPHCATMIGDLLATESAKRVTNAEKGLK